MSPPGLQEDQTCRDSSGGRGHRRALPKLTISQSRTPNDHLKGQERRLWWSLQPCPADGHGAKPRVEWAARAWAESAAPQGDATASPPALASTQSKSIAALTTPERDGGGRGHGPALVPLPAGLTHRSWWCTRCSSGTRWPSSELASGPGETKSDRQGRGDALRTEGSCDPASPSTVGHSC